MTKAQFLAELSRRVASGEITQDEVIAGLKRKRGRPKTTQKLTLREKLAKPAEQTLMAAGEIYGELIKAGYSKTYALDRIKDLYKWGDRQARKAVERYKQSQGIAVGRVKTLEDTYQTRDEFLKSACQYAFGDEGEVIYQEEIGPIFSVDPRYKKKP